MKNAEIIISESIISEIMDVTPPKNGGHIPQIGRSVAQVNVRGGKVESVSPYNADYVSKAKAIGGRWNCGEWVFDLERFDEVVELCRAVYGHVVVNPGAVIDEIVGAGTYYLVRPLSTTVYGIVSEPSVSGIGVGGAKVLAKIVEATNGARDVVYTEDGTGLSLSVASVYGQRVVVINIHRGDDVQRIPYGYGCCGSIFVTRAFDPEVLDAIDQL
ncbi:MAG: hypothetical protein AB7E51_02440 [Pseudodesulfovibrio sp.]|uniref:hypothetical protein n=1 Tax=Pseudodesulfovibrio sp. TaxID=2035812 RepID=UPI003D10D95B